MPEGVRVLEAAGRKFGLELKWDEYPWSCEYRAKHGRMMPEDGLATIRDHDAVSSAPAAFPAFPTTSRCGSCSSRCAAASTCT